MNHINIEGNRIAYAEQGSGKRSIVFLHGWTCNHTHFAPQLKVFGETFRVVAPDLRGHGRSDTPHGEYTLNRFTSDICQLCDQVGLEKPLLVGHSMGGALALELAVRYPKLPSGVLLLDTLLMPGCEFVAALHDMHTSLRTNYSHAVEEVAALLQLPANSLLCASILEGMRSTPPHVALSAFKHHVLEYDAAASIQACRVPAGYIRSLPFMADLDQLKQIWPDLKTAETLGSGHFSMLEVPDQINAMLHRFCSLVWPIANGRNQGNPV